MQNSGLGNAVNPLASLAHTKVYSIPMLLLIGWRGSPFVKKDEPQHMVKGKITRNLLKLLDIKYCVLRNKRDLRKLSQIIKFGKKKQKPVACLIENNTLLNNSIKKQKKIKKFCRSDVIKTILSKIKKNTRIISTTGYTSRELNQIRETSKFKTGKDFYMIGAMGHSSILALGYSINSKNQTLCLDGDGSLLMHMGSLSNCGIYGKKNFKHILLNNHSHESVGGQKTLASKINFKKLVNSLGYRKYFFAENNKKLLNVFNKFLRSSGPSFLEIKIDEGHLSNLTRPTNFLNIKKKFN